MPKLHLPETVEILHTVQATEDKKLVNRQTVVTSQTETIEVPFSGPLAKSFKPENVENAKVLKIYPGSTREFTEDEAAFLLGLYPFLQKVEDKVELSGTTPQKEEAPKAPLGDPNLSPLELPSNFMHLKKFVSEKGIVVEKTDTRETILKKLAEIS